MCHCHDNLVFSPNGRKRKKIYPTRNRASETKFRAARPKSLPNQIACEAKTTFYSKLFYLGFLNFQKIDIKY